jgi:lipopolysaccharide transport system ATP-binding protein
MVSIQFNQASVEIPIFNASTRSLTNRLIQVATGGQLTADSQGRVVVKALNDLNFEVKEGERVALLGHNGAGKTSLLRMLSGVYHPTSGQAIVKGEVGSLIDLSLGIDNEATGRENIFIRGALLGLRKSKINAKIEEIIEFSELGDFIDMPVRTYSSGMQLRLAFSVSTIVRPEILLMDEWLSVGDENFKQKAEERLKNLVQSTKILVIATHSRKLAETTCNRVIWLEHGAIKMDGDPKQICDLYFGKE